MNNTELDEMREKEDLAMWKMQDRFEQELSLNTTQNAHCGQLLADFLEEISTIETKALRKAVVRKKAELPIPYIPVDSNNNLDQSFAKGAKQQRDIMLAKHFVEEVVKDG